MLTITLPLTLTTEPKQSAITHPTSFPSPHKQRSIPSKSVSPNPFPALGRSSERASRNEIARAAFFFFPPCQVPTPPRPRVPPNGFFSFFFFRTVDGPNRAVPPTHTSTSQPSNDDDCGTGHGAGHVALFDLSSRWLKETKCRGRWRVLISCRYARNDGQCA